jgi:hypothetical protein
MMPSGAHDSQGAHVNQYPCDYTSNILTSWQSKQLSVTYQNSLAVQNMTQSQQDLHASEPIAEAAGPDATLSSSNSNSVKIHLRPPINARNAIDLRSDELRQC